jgi:spermidine/putrescine transport system ATP-binding protein
VLEVRNIHKSFGSQTALSRINLSIAEGEFFSLLGPSGCGKSTLLRILAGLEAADAGEILWKGKRIDLLRAQDRPFNMVFQRYALFQHMTVAQNLAFGLKIKKCSRREIDERVLATLELVRLKDFANRYPDTLSGGQAQRVALARALVNRPACLLLDEPLSALDQKLRDQMQSELRLLQKELGLTFIFVTHDQEEAMLMSDRVAVMNNGVIEQLGTPRELFENPSSLFGARFVGRRNEFAGVSHAWTGSVLQVKIGDLDLSGNVACSALAEDLKGRSKGIAIRAFVRPELISISRQSGKSGGISNVNSVDGLVLEVLFRGASCEVIVETVAMGRVVVETASSKLESLSRGSQVSLDFSPGAMQVFSEHLGTLP